MELAVKHASLELRRQQEHATTLILNQATVWNASSLMVLTKELRRRILLTAVILEAAKV